MDRQRVLITGASSGIGESVARLLVTEGYDVIGTYLYPEELDQAPEEVHYIQLDLNDPSSIDACIGQIDSIDILINNAGRSHIGPAEEFPLDRTRSLFETNCFGAIRMIQACLPGMREKRRGYILNIGSLAAQFAVPFQSGYVASKAALGGYTLSLRNEVASFGIRVVLLEPNDIRTRITPEIFIGEGSEYGVPVRRMEAVRNERMKKASSPEIVAKKVSRIIKKSRPGPYYSVGGHAPMLVFLKRFLSGRFVEKMVRNNYRIGK